MFTSLAAKMHEIGKLQDTLREMGFIMFGIYRANNHFNQIFIEFQSQEVVIKVHAATYSYLYTDVNWHTSVIYRVNERYNRFKKKTKLFVANQ